MAWMTEKPKTSIRDAVQEGWGGTGNGVMGAPEGAGVVGERGGGGVAAVVDFVIWKGKRCVHAGI